MIRYTIEKCEGKKRASGTKGRWIVRWADAERRLMASCSIAAHFPTQKAAARAASAFLAVIAFHADREDELRRTGQDGIEVRP